jgi:hypothetical protein
MKRALRGGRLYDAETHLAKVVDRQCHDLLARRRLQANDGL